MTTSRMGPLIDYLVTTFTAASTLGQATPAVLVFDGPPVTANPAPLALYVGVDDVFTDPGTATSATSDQTRGGLGVQRRQETVTVNCCAVAWSGVDDMKTIRTAAFGIAGAVEDLVRTNNDYFGGNAGLADPGVSGLVLQQSNADGTTVQVAFGITFKSFIGA